MSTTPSADRPPDYDGGYKKAGKKAEAIALAFLTGNPNVDSILDVRANEEWQHKDVDFSLLMTDGSVSLVEVKSDRHLGVTGNVLFEILRINHTASHEHAGVLGWSARSEADTFIFYSPTRKELWVCKADKYRAVFQRYTREMREKTNTRYEPTDAIKSTINVLIPERYFGRMFKKYDVAEIADRLYPDDKE